MSNSEHEFGGRWTEQKLSILERYLKAWLQIFNKNPNAQYYRKVYVDAFAGTGYRSRPKIRTPNFGLVNEEASARQELLRGSVSRAMALDPGFDRYYFVDSKKAHAASLEEFQADPRVRVRGEDANAFLLDWCGTEDWRKTRAVVFLDPYGMQVDWTTLEALAGTEAVDLWLLFPIGSAVNRLLTRKKAPPESWARRLTAFFGTNQWKDVFYKTGEQQTLFGPEEFTRKTATWKSIEKFFVTRLEDIFPAVAPSPAVLRNRRKSPLFLFCFACANPNEKAHKVALRISNHLLTHI